MNKPLTIDFVWQARLTEARKAARLLVWELMLSNPDPEKRRLLCRVYKRLCD